MSGPTEHSWNKLKRFGRYLKGRPRVIQEFKPQRFPTEIAAYVDSDRAGCQCTCRSTSGMILMCGSHCLKASSTVQSTIALSSGESEFCSIVTGAAACLGLQAMYHDWGVTISCTVKSDQSPWSWENKTCPNKISLGPTQSEGQGDQAGSCFNPR